MTDLLPTELTTERRASLLRVLIAATFLLFFQTYMVAPLIPALADALGVERQRIGLLIPAYAIPYAFAALACGVIADRFGRRGLLFAALAAFPIIGLAMAAAPGFDSLLGLRVISGISNVGIIVVGLSLVGDLFPPGERGAAFGWMFGALAGGAAFGSTLGGLLAPLVGWRGLFAIVAAAGVVVLAFAIRLWPLLASGNSASRGLSFRDALRDFAALLSTRRGARTFGYIFANAVFHSGVFTWLGVLLHDRYGLGEAGIGLALLGYGVPGFLLGPTIGRIVDRHGRRRIIPAGLLVAAASAAALAPYGPLWLAAAAITVLSLGFDMSHPLFAGIATSLDDKRRGQAMGLNTFSIFLGLGVGSLAFGAIMRLGLGNALVGFAVVQAILGVVAIPLFRDE